MSKTDRRFLQITTMSEKRQSEYVKKSTTQQQKDKPVKKLANDLNRSKSLYKSIGKENKGRGLPDSFLVSPSSLPSLNDSLPILWLRSHYHGWREEVGQGRGAGRESLLLASPDPL